MLDILHPPVEIAPNLQAGVRVGDHWVTVGYSERPAPDGRTRYRWEIIFQDGTDESGDDMLSGAVCADRSLTAALETLLAFLGAAAEQAAYALRTGKEALFSRRVIEFARQYADEISILETQLSEQDEEDDK